MRAERQNYPSDGVRSWINQAFPLKDEPSEIKGPAPNLQLIIGVIRACHSQANTSLKHSEPPGLINLMDNPTVEQPF